MTVPFYYAKIPSVRQRYTVKKRILKKEGFNLMEMMTSAAAGKKLKKLNEEKLFWREKENEGCVYIAEIDEEPVIPEYDFAEVSAKIAEIDDEVIRIKHALNLSNASNTIMVGETQYTIDQVLIRMAQLNSRRDFCDCLRKNSPKSRLSGRGRYYSGIKNAKPEYQYTNYDPELVQREFERLDNEIVMMQMALDKYNQTVEFAVDI